MLTKSQKVSYLIDSVLHYGSPVVCPSCGSTHASEVDRKFVVTRLFECDKCKLYFRHPTDSAEVNKKFYQKEYMEGDGITTYMPSQAELEDLKKMEEEGVEILTCGTCLKHYGLMEKLMVGKVTDMYTIAERMTGADKVIRP